MNQTFPLHTDLSLDYRYRASVLPGQSNPGHAEAPLLLLLHGVGSNERDLLQLEPWFDRRFQLVSARAPLQFGADAFGWFNVAFTPEFVHDREEAQASRRTLLSFIDELSERFRVSSHRIYLVGFSQGAAMSLSIALTAPQKLGGVVAMSGPLLDESDLDSAKGEALQGMPILVTHGVRDEVLPIRHARAARARLEGLPVALDYREYDMGHEVSEEVVGDVVLWLERRD